MSANIPTHIPRKSRGKHRFNSSDDEIFDYSFDDTTDSSEREDSTGSNEGNQKESASQKLFMFEKQALMDFENHFYVEKVIGVKEETSESDDPQYYVKWLGKSYIHCSWVPRSELVNLENGEASLKKFLKKSNNGTLNNSLSIPSLVTFNDEINANWFQVDRIIEQSEDRYLTKWNTMPYDQCTWELESDIPDKSAIDSFHQRQQHFNPTKIGSNPRHVNPQSFVPIESTISDKNGNTLRDYQVNGFNWLRYCWYNSCNSILADEMGLGKTVQVVSALTDISRNHGINGPFLVIAPLSTLPHWKKEFESWSTLNCVIFHGSPTSKEIIKRYEINVYDANGNVDPTRVRFDVLITNYETLMSDYEVFNCIEWRYLVLDEGHRLKNHNGKCYRMLEQIKFEHCTLLTGTPIQNNVEELWSLLHFLHPNIFNNLPMFLEKFGKMDNEKLHQLQDLIKKFLLRRKKSDVDKTIAAKEETIIEVELTRTQKTYYRAFLHENASTLLQQITGGALPSLLNLMMQLRKVCNHPFLLKGAEEHIEEETAKKMNKPINDYEVLLHSIVDSSGKLILIHKLLPKLREGNHKVLIFSQMVKVLDILEDYLDLIGYKHERIDGSVPENERQLAIDRFANDPDAFIFLLCTKAGGMGINLTAADTVIIYDSDWNPQNDLQAESRCHRIGQKSKVKVYRLVTRGTYELEMLDRASKKLGLDHALLDGGDISSSQKPLAAQEVEKLLRRGVYDLANEDETEIDNFCSEDIDQILERRSKSLIHNEITGDSIFNKATFNAENDELDLNAKDFWSKALPQLRFSSEELLPERRCKQQKMKFSDYSDDEIIEKKHKRKISTYNQPTPRAIYLKLMHHGYSGNNFEKMFILKIVQKENLTPEQEALILKILNVDSLDFTSEEIENAEKKLSSPMSEFNEKCDTLINRIIFFYNLKPVLGYIQNDLYGWPMGTSLDPMIDYAILYGINLNGIGKISKVLQNIELDRMPRNLSDKAVAKIAYSLVESFQNELLDFDTKTLPTTFMRPKEWKEKHLNLFNRMTMTNDEFMSLFNTLTYLGYPKICKRPSLFIEQQFKIVEDVDQGDENNGQTDGENVEQQKPIIENQQPNNDEQEQEENPEEEETDFQKIQELSGLTCIEYNTFKDNCELLYSFYKKTLSQKEEDSVVDRLGSYGNKVWISRFRRNNSDLERIRFFVNHTTPDEVEILKSIRVWDIGPKWWGPNYDAALLVAINDYGILLTSVWLFDPDRPFRQRIPENLIDDFQKAVEAENERLHSQKPKNPGDFMFIYNEKARISRALMLMQFVQTKLHKQLKFMLDNDSSQSQGEIEISELPATPLYFGNSFYIQDFGTFISKSSQYPVGYICRRLYFSIKDPSEKSWYEASTAINDKGKFTFIVKHLSEPKVEFVSFTSSGVWEQLIQEVQAVRGKLGLPKRKHTTVSGPSMYGFSNPKVVEIFRYMKANCEDD
ncbi:SNF2 family N-terminal domain containing protein [Histomonas meleagridis]|uniref:SNF2 family N-terminal domain containing protein n=1 Tax=Histomonas meleagridis TaxID=135588 RepID=UPI00355A1671|nr:SNF2 family N-terminal domain containing protein [Histomonas meleagridis]KAH0799425.1 SNF2 family N-terminal domain containing protein [Histomonas meleagridis]